MLSAALLNVEPAAACSKPLERSTGEALGLDALVNSSGAGVNSLLRVYLQGGLFVHIELRDGPRRSRVSRRFSRKSQENQAENLRPDCFKQPVKRNTRSHCNLPFWQSVPWTLFSSKFEKSSKKYASIYKVRKKFGLKTVYRQT